MDRRTFLARGAAVLGGAAVSGGAAYGAWIGTHSSAGPGSAKSGRPGKRPTTGGRRSGAGKKFAPVENTTLPSGVTVPTARWVVEENALPGTTAWIVTGPQAPGAIEGFADSVSAQAGETVSLFVNTTATTFHVEAYRMGYYQGLGARLVWTSPELTGRSQAPPQFTPGINMIECHWDQSVALELTDAWTPGCYLLKLVGSGGEQQYVPLTVRDDASRAAYVIQNSVTTWEAYNLWGGYSLYLGATPGGGQTFANRSRTVSFDRPYAQDISQGSSDFLGNEYPLISWAEELGLDVTYWTDVDLHARPQLLTNHRCLFSMGHDEYWSMQMRNAALAALPAGVNLAFLGANACYRQIRLDSSPLGPNRHEICYKDAAEDPLDGVDDALVTAPSWDSPPTSWPESILIGSMYQSIGANAPLAVADTSSWLMEGTGLINGITLPHVVQGEYDRFDLALAGPRNVEIVAHSPVVKNGTTNYSDVTYYTVTNAGGVFATGTAAWVFKLADFSPVIPVHTAVPGVTAPLRRIMENVFGVFGAGPAGMSHPSQENWQQFY
ncbi:MAG: hypothetical protein M0020_01600 [Actinomycetota bacterium]|nr:hypothetical protein [Actinomycetota bacterium]